MPGKITKSLWQRGGFRLLAGALFVAGIGAVFASWTKSENVDRAPATLGEAVPEDFTGLRFHPAENFRYRYSFERKIEFRGFGNALPEVGYHGELTFDVLKAGEEGLEAVAQEKVEEYGGGMPSPLVKLSLTADGTNLKMFTTGKTATEEERQHIAVTKDLLSLWAFPLRKDTVGSYEATVQAQPAEAGQRVLKKTKLRYVEASAPVIVHSSHWMRWDEKTSLPGDLRGEETTKMGQKKNDLFSRTTYRLRLIAVEKIGMVKNIQFTKAEDMSLQREALMLAEHPDYAGLNWQAVLAQLRELEKMSANEQLSVFGDLVRLLKKDPALLKKLLAELPEADLRAGADSALFKTVIGALATLGSPEAQAALRSIFDDPNCPVSGKGSILAAFTTTQAPATPETRAFLAAKMGSEDKDVAQGAAFALGAALQGSAGDSAAVEKLRAAFRAERANNNLPGQLAMLDSMGNSGRAEYVPDLRETVASGNAELRARALFSLRFMNNAESADLISRGLSDPETMVRESATEAIKLASWNENFRAPLESCARGEKVSRIQASCGDILRAHPQMASN